MSSLVCKMSSVRLFQLTWGVILTSQTIDHFVAASVSEFINPASLCTSHRI